MPPPRTRGGRLLEANEPACLLRYAEAEPYSWCLERIACRAVKKHPISDSRPLKTALSALCVLLLGSVAPVLAGGPIRTIDARRALPATQRPQAASRTRAACITGSSVGSEGGAEPAGNFFGHSRDAAQGPSLIFNLTAGLSAFRRQIVRFLSALVVAFRGVMAVNSGWNPDIG